MNAIEIIDAGDLLVVGAGAAGLLTAVLAQRQGMSVTLIDQNAVGAEQSGHHHGLLHRGFLYLDASVPFVDALTIGREAWTEHLESVQPCADSTIAAFSDPWQASKAFEYWSAAGLSADQVMPPPYLRQPVLCFETGERCYDFTPVWETLVAELGLSKTVRARATQIHLDEARVRSVGAALESGRRLVEFRADRYVIAAGAGIDGLLANSRRFSRSMVNRTSFMLVVDAPDLADQNLLSPEPQYSGLFSCPRSKAGRRVWLIGDHVSLDGVGGHELSEKRWLSAVIETLRRSTTILDATATRVGVYTAPKAELRDQPMEMRPWAIDNYELSNFLVVTPTKLTLAAAAARDAVQRMDRIQQHGGGNRAQELDDLEHLTVATERWTETPLSPLESLY